MTGSSKLKIDTYDHSASITIANSKTLAKLYIITTLKMKCAYFFTTFSDNLNNVQQS